MPSIEIMRQDRETNQSLIRRFTRRLKESGIVNAAKKKRFTHRAKSHKAEQVSALRKIEMRAEYEKEQKFGKSKK